MPDIKLADSLTESLTSKDIKKAIEESTLKISEKGEMKSEDWKRWASNAFIKWIRPLALMYLVSVIAVVQTNGHVFQLSDLVPTREVVGGMILWTLNALYDLLNKWQEIKVYAK